MNSPLLSVCLISYNHENYIKQAIEGVLMQKVNFKIEIIIADDCSDDDTQKIIQEYCYKHSSIIKPILRQKNVGAAQNFVELITTPKSKYIAYIEGDDYWIDPYKLQKQVDFLESRLDIDVCFTRAKIFSESEFKLQRILPKYIETPFSYCELLKYHNFITTATVLFRKPKHFVLPDWFVTLPYGDMGLYKLLSNSNNFYGLKDVTSVYRVHDGGTYSGINKLSSRKTYYTFYKQIYPYLNTEEQSVSRQKMTELLKEIGQLRFKDHPLKQRLYSFGIKIGLFT